MSKDDKPAADERTERLAAALKENLRRRKAQVRNRRDAGGRDGGVSDGERSERGGPGDTAAGPSDDSGNT